MTSRQASHNTYLYRGVAEYALRWAHEHPDGRCNFAFEFGLIDYRLDLDDAMRETLTRAERIALILKHDFGYSDEQACLMAILMERPEQTMARIETRLGRALLARHMGGLSTYLKTRS